VPCTLRGVSYLLHRLGFTPQVAAHRAAERDEDAIAAWRSKTWARARALAAATGAWICFEDESGQALQPPKARTWGRRGHTPVARVSGRGSGRIPVAGLACVKAGHCHAGAPQHRAHHPLHPPHGTKQLLSNITGNSGNSG
jgi:hypothetical protein